MRTLSRRKRSYKKDKILELKNKVLYKVIQWPTSAITNILLVFFIGRDFLTVEYMKHFEYNINLVFGIFVLTLISVFSSNVLAICIVLHNNNETKVNRIISRGGSIGRFFGVAILYSFIMGIVWSFGVFNIIWSIYGGSIFIFFILYIIMYLIVEFFSFGVVSFIIMYIDPIREK